MPLPSYQIMVIDCTTGNYTGVFDGTTFMELRYTRKLNDIGTIAFSVDGTAENYNVFAWDNLIEVMRTNPVTGILAVEETYLVRSKQIFTDENGRDILVVGGMSLAHLLTRRIILPSDDPAAVNGYSVKSGAADSVMRGYCREQAADLASADRQITGLTVAAVAGSGVTIEESCRYNILFNKIKDIAIRSGVDFQLTRTSGLNFELAIAPYGNDYTRSTNYPYGRWVGFAPERRNLNSPSLKEDRTKEKNFVYTLGQGQGASRKVETYAGDVGHSPFGRCEYVKDARNVDKNSTSGLQTAAIQSVKEEKINREFSFSPTNIEVGAIYKVDYDLADKVTALWKGLEFDLRVTTIEFNVSGSGETLTVYVEELYN